MRRVNEEIANIQYIKNQKGDLPLDTLVLKGCRGCIKTEFRSKNNHLGVRDFLVQLRAHQHDMYSQIPMDFWKCVCSLTYPNSTGGEEKAV